MGHGKVPIRGRLNLDNEMIYNKLGAKVDRDFRISDLVKNPDGTYI